MAELLTEVEYGRILGSFTAVAEDFGDTVAPDAIPLAGKVVFSPSISHVTYINSDGETASLYLHPVTASIIDGRLVGSEGNDGVVLLASNSNNVSASVLWNAHIYIDPLGPDQDAPEVHKFLIEVRRNEISSLIDVIKANSRVHNVALFHDAIAEAAAKFWERVEAGEFRGNQGPPGPAGVGVGVPGPIGRPGIIGKDGDPGVGGNLLPDGDLEEPGFLVTGDYQETSDSASGSKAVTLTHATSRKIRLEPETSYVGTVYLKSPEASTATITMRVFGSEGDIDRVIENAYNLPADTWRRVTFLLDSNLGDQSMEIITTSDGRTISADLYTLSDNSVVQGLQRDLSAAQAQLEAAMAQLDLDLAEVESNRVILAESLNDLAVVLEDGNVDLTELNEELADLKNDLAAEETKRQEADVAAQLILDQLDTNLAQARTDLDANSEIIGQLDTDLAQSLEDLEESRAKIDTLENVTLPGLKAILEEADRQAREDLATLDGLLSGLDTALQENEQSIEELTTSILPELRTSLEENSTALSDMDTTLSEAKTDLAQISTDLTTEREERIAAVGAAQGTLTELDEKLSTAFPDGPFNIPNELAQTIYRSDVQYAVSSSETVAPTTGWSGNSPTREPGEFVWFRTVITYGDSTTATSGAALMTGNTGEAGRPGEKGDPGEDGTSVTIKGTLDSVSDLPASGDAGDSYLVGGYLYIWSGSWENVGLIRGPQGVPGEPGADGKPRYTWVKYADTSEGLGMSDDPAGKRYIGLAFNKTEQTESTNTADYQWTLFEGPEGLPGDKGDQGVGVESITPFFRQQETSAPKPSQPSGMAPAGWTAEEPLWAQNTALWRAERVIYTNNVISWTPVTLVSAHTGIDKAIIDAREASNEAVAAQAVADAAQDRINSGLNLVNDPSRTKSTDGWTISQGNVSDHLAIEDRDMGHGVVSALKHQNTGHTTIYSDYFEIDPTQAYEFRLTFDKPETNPNATSDFYFGAHIAASDRAYRPVDFVRTSDSRVSTTATNFYFWYANGPYDGPTELVGYVLPIGVSDEVAGSVGNGTYNARLTSPDTAMMRLRFLNYDNMDFNYPVWVSNVSVRAVSVQDLIRAQSADAAAKEAKVRADEAHELAVGKPDMSEVQQAITASANSKNSVVRSTVSPNKDGAVSGDIWYQVVDLDTVGSEVAKWIWDGNKWVQSLINSEMIEYLDVLKVTGQDADFRTFFAEKLTANEAVIDDLWANALAVKTITAQQVTVAPGNSFPDPSGMIEGTRNSVGGTPWSWDNTGKYWKRAAVNGGTTQFNAYLNTTTGYDSGPLTPGETYRIAYDIWGNGTTDIGRGRAAIYYRKADGSTIFVGDGYGATDGDPDPDTGNLQRNQWHHVERTWIAPDDAVSGGFAFQLLSTSASATEIRIRNPFIGVKSGAVSIKDGAISADKITSGAITTEKLHALAITAEKIATSAITTNKIAAKAINASKIAANTITASEINSESVAAEVGKFLKLNVGSLVASDVQVDSAVIDRIWADGIVAKAATFNKITVATGDLLPDLASSVEAQNFSDLGYWTNFGINQGDPSFWVNGADRDSRYIEYEFRMEAGVQYRFSVDVKASKAGARFYWEPRMTSGSNDRPGMDFISGPGNNTYPFMGVSVTTGYQTYESVATCRVSGTYKILVYPNHSTGADNAGGHMWFRGASIRPMTGAVLIEDGAVNASKINAESVGAAVGEFVKLDVKNLTSSTANINSLVAQKIAAGTAAFQTVNADKIVASTGTMDSATINQIWADGIAAKAITAASITVGSSNAYPDPDLQESDGWNSDRYNSTGGRNGGGSILIEAGTAQRGSYFNLSGSPAGVPIKPGKYKMGAWMRPSVSYTGRGPTMYARLYRDDGTWSFADTGGTNYYGDGTANRWQYEEWEMVVPDDGFTRLVIGFYINNPYPGAARFSDPTLRPMVGAVLIEDGAVSANHLTSNSVDTKHLRADAVDAEKIRAGAVTTDKMVANTIDGDRIRANTLHANKILANTITASKIASKTISAEEIKARTILATNIVASTITANEIKARTITAAEILAGTITANELDVGNITANTGFIDNLWTNGLSAKSITAARVTVNPGNMIPGMSEIGSGVRPNPDPFPGWTLQSGGYLYTRGTTTLNIEAPIPVQAGVKYKLSFDINASIANTRYFIQIMGANADGSTGGTNPGIEGSSNTYLASNVIVSGANTWYTQEYEWTPANNGYAILRFYTNHGNGTSTSTTVQRYRRFSLQSMIGSTLIEGGAIDGQLITGATIRTAASGSRVQLDSQGIRAYNSSGTLSSSISALTGAVNLTGNITQENSYGSAIFGPSTYYSPTISPSLSFSVPGESWWGPGGVYTRADNSSGQPATRMQGFLKGESKGSHLQLAAGGTTTESSTYIERMFDGSHRSGLYLASNNNVSLYSGGGTLRLASRNTANTLSLSRINLQASGSAFLIGENVLVDTESTDGTVTIRKRNTEGTATGAWFQVSRTGVEMYSSTGKALRVTNNEIYGNGLIGRTITGPRSQVVVGNGGVLGVEGSSRRWKTEIETVDPATYADGLLSIDFSSWLSREDVEKAEAYRAWREDHPMTPVPVEFDQVDEDPVRQYGVIAEQLAESGVPGIVGYDEEGLPATVDRANIGVALVPIVKQLLDRVAELERMIGEMDG